MTDLNPEIWDNDTLGAAAPNENLDRLERQQIEDRAAKFEDREPREIVVDNTYPGWTPEVNERTGTVPSNYQTVHFADENPNDIPVDSGRPDEDAGTVTEENENPADPGDGTESQPPVEGWDDSGSEEGAPESDGDSESFDNAPVETEPASSDDESASTESNSTEENGTTKWN